MLTYRFNLGWHVVSLTKGLIWSMVGGLFRLKCDGHPIRLITTTFYPLVLVVKQCL